MSGPRHLEVVRSSGPGKRPSMSVEVLGMSIFLASLGVLFIASIIAYLWVRMSAVVWRAESMPALPRGLWMSTVIIIGASVTIHRALTAARKNDQQGMRRGLGLTLGLGVLFLAMQGFNWLELVHANLPPNARSLYAFTFYMLTGLHAVHVVGGILPLAVVTRRAFAGAYSSVNHRGITYQAMYWHFLDGVWIVLLAVISIAS